MIRKRSVETGGLTAQQAISAFRWSTDGDGLSHAFVDAPYFRTPDDAARGWERVRRDVWARCHRFSIPASATTFDGLTMVSAAFVRDGWDRARFSLRRALAAVARDRQALDAFTATPDAQTIADFIEMLRQDLATVEAVARQMADCPAERRPYPATLHTAARYGDGAGPADAVA